MKRILSFLSVSLVILLGVTTIAYANSLNRDAKSDLFSTSLTSSAGTDSPFRKVGNLVYISGQGAGSISTDKLQDSRAQIKEAFEKLRAVAISAGGDLDKIIKINVYLADLPSDYALLNEISPQYFKEPYPARSTVGVASLPLHHRIEIDAIMVTHENIKN